MGKAATHHVACVSVDPDRPYLAVLEVPKKIDSLEGRRGAAVHIATGDRITLESSIHGRIIVYRKCETGDRAGEVTDGLGNVLSQIHI